MNSEIRYIEDTEINNRVEELKHDCVVRGNVDLIIGLAFSLLVITGCTLLNMRTTTLNLIVTSIPVVVVAIIVAVSGIISKINEGKKYKTLNKDNLYVINTTIEDIKNFNGLEGIYGSKYGAKIKGIKEVCSIPDDKYKDVNVGGTVTVLVHGKHGSEIDLDAVEVVWYNSAYSGGAWSSIKL